MADTNTPDRKSRMDKAEDERWSSESDSVGNSDRSSESMERGMSEGGGISNRPLDEETANQESLPARGQSRIEHPGNTNVEREEVGSGNEKDIER